MSADGAAAAALSIPSPPALPTVQLPEVYRHGPGWKVRCLGDGCQDGLARLLEVHGIEVADDEAPAPAPAAARPPIRLTKGEEQLPGEMRERLSLRKEAVANVLFVKGIGDQRARVILVLDASGSMDELYPETMPQRIFWQFVGLGTEEDYGVLERFDTLPGSTIDNVGFFSIDDIEQIDDAELYDRILSEFPAWLRAARAAKLI